MEQAAACRVLAIMGSGETSPTMVEVHKALIARLGPRRRAVLLETPYAFQENTADDSARALEYFSRSVGLNVTAIAAGGPLTGTGPADDGGLAALSAADWAFAGPGSPSFALARWRAGPVADLLRDRVRTRDGITLLASAAAATVGLAALPVYEIYKAGIAPHWLEGLDLLGLLGIRAAVIPHYDNAEGRTHDTRYCYLGERRLALLEQELPADAAVLGVDEHTAAVFDLRTAAMTVTGRGTVTVRRAGSSTILPPGTVIALAQLRAMIAGHAPAPAVRPAASPPLAGAADPP